VSLVGSGLVIPFTGTGTSHNCRATHRHPGTLNFGSVVVEVPDHLRNVSASGGSVTISSAGSSSAQFGLPGASFPLTIPAGQSVSINVAFTPQNSGTASGDTFLHKQCGELYCNGFSGGHGRDADCQSLVESDG